MNNTIALNQEKLSHHPIYETFDSIESIRHFMRYHVFAVWDFMSLLKSLQRKITCVDHPWRPSPYPSEMVRLINQIVLGEESDLDQKGNAVSHFELYLRAMEEVGASTMEIRDFLNTLDMNLVPTEARRFVEHNLLVAECGHVVEVAASFFFGREKLIPGMFESMVEVLERENIEAPTFIYYLKRHIEVDSDEHGPLAMKCLEYLVGEDEDLARLSFNAGIRAMSMREELWDRVLLSLSPQKIREALRLEEQVIQ